VHLGARSEESAAPLPKRETYACQWRRRHTQCLAAGGAARGAAGGAASRQRTRAAFVALSARNRKRYRSARAAQQRPLRRAATQPDALATELRREPPAQRGSAVAALQRRSRTDAATWQREQRIRRTVDRRLDGSVDGHGS
jgi:hypothetical protein